MQELLPLANPVHKVTILPRGRALGVTWGMPQEDKYLTTRQEFYDDIAAFLGGRVAEQIVFNEITTGASNDLDRATDNGPLNGDGIRHERPLGNPQIGKPFR